jgi:hypothetical protein
VSSAPSFFLIGDAQSTVIQVVGPSFEPGAAFQQHDALTTLLRHTLPILVEKRQYALQKLLFLLFSVKCTETTRFYVEVKH